MQMTYSLDGLHLTEGFEGCRLTAYQDEGGVWTNGYGNTHGVVPGSTITQEQAEADLRANVQNAVNAVNRLVTQESIPQHWFDALVDFTFNAGAGNLASSTLLRDVNAGNFAAADLQFQRWDMAGGAHIAGLERRRLAEAALAAEPETYT